jgi:Mg2+-importing ATPase
MRPVLANCQRFGISQNLRRPRRLDAPVIRSQTVVDPSAPSSRGGIHETKVPPGSANEPSTLAAARGLTSAAAERLLSEVGPNDPSARHHRSQLVELLILLANPLVIILLVASAISAFLGEIANALIVGTMVVLSTALNFVQAYRSQRAAEQLRHKVAPTATVLRDGRWQELRRVEVVPGDVVQLCAGDLVPADARLVEARDLHVQQAALTGESMPVEKAAQPDSEPKPLNERRDMVFLGTSVVSGTAKAIVVATGRNTMFGDIAARLAARPPETEFERGVRQFSLLIMRTVFLLVLFIVVARVALHRGALESLLFAVALAVGLTPEFLPMITTVTLGKAAVRMAREKVIVKHLPAIENLGSIDVLCCDKTGTLTAGKMSLECSVDAGGAPAPHPHALAHVNSRFETGIKSPLDAAIVASEPPDSIGWEKIDEIPFDFERRRSSIVAKKDGGDAILVTKGAPEGVLAIASACELEGREQPLDESLRARCRATYESLGEKGLRVLAIASRRVDKRDAYGVADERDLVLAGFLAFTDPPRPDVAQTLAALARDGVAVKIVTGDNERVACHVCAAVGLDLSNTVLGDAIESMSDPALEHVAERATVFARVSPAQKSRILLALKHRGHVVGFLGDGINDAPSLHAADVGISVASAVDVAKDAADIILLEASLGVLHTGIIEGRKAFGNVTKYVLMGTSSNFGNMFSMAAVSLFLPFLPMLPVQILLNNLLYDVSQITIPTDNVDDTYVREPQRWNVRAIRNFMLLIGPVSSLYDFLTFFALLHFFHASERLFHSGWFMESLATQTLVIFVIRTSKNPLRSRPSAPLAATVLAVVSLGMVLPFVPTAQRLLGFEPLPPVFFVFLFVVVTTYLGLVELAKQIAFRSHHVSGAASRGIVHVS